MQMKNVLSVAAVFNENKTDFGLKNSNINNATYLHLQI